jgi:TolB-like protein
MLPFANMNLTKDQEYFSEGLSEQLINDLAKVSGMMVVGQSSSFQLKGHDEDLRDVGRRLGVANILKGSVRRGGDHVRITAELIEACNGYQLWSQSYDPEIEDVFTVEDAIAESVTEALKLKLLGGAGQPVGSTPSSANPDAYQAYLKANYSRDRGNSPDKTLALVNIAIGLDQKYAPSWAFTGPISNTRWRINP